MPQFLHPLWLLLPLLVIPAALAGAARDRGKGGRLGPLVPDRLRARLVPGGASRPTGRLLLRFLLLALFGLALARPQFGEEGVVETAEARDLVLAFDTSRSMLATDVAPNRLELAKLASLDLIRALPDDRFGVLGFAGSAFPLAPLTTDHDAIRETIMAIDTETLPVGGTSLGAAVESAMEAFDDPGPRQRALILLTDGEDLEGKLDGLAEKAREKGILIFAFAIGTERGSMIPDPRAEGGFTRDARGQPVVSKASLDVLGKLANATGGYAAMLAGPGSLPTQMSQALQRLESAATEEKIRSQAAEQFQWPLGLALVVLAVCLVRRSGRAPLRQSPDMARPGATAVVRLLLGVALAGAAIPPTHAADPAGEARTAFESGEYDKAIAGYASALLDPDPVRRSKVAANLGHALYEAGRTSLPEDEKSWTIPMMKKTLVDWEDALGHLDHSLSVTPDSPEVRENRKLVAEALDKLRKRLREMEEEEKKAEEKKEQQEKDKQKDPEQDQEQQEQNQSNQTQDEQEQKQRQGESENNGGKEPGQNEQSPPKPGESGEKDAEQEDQAGKPGQPKPGESGENGKPSEEPNPDGKSPDQQKDGKDAKSPSDEELSDASTGEQRGGRETASSIPMKLDANGRIVLPEDPRERARAIETIRRTLEQRSMENKNVRLIPAPEDSRRPDKDW